MSEKKQAIQDALVAGAKQDLRGQPLYDFVKQECPEAKSKKIVDAALHALSDPKLRERHILDIIYDLALSRRLAADEKHHPQGEPGTGSFGPKLDKRPKS